MKTTHLPIACLFVITGLISCNNNDEEKQESIPGTGTLQTASGLKPVDTLITSKQTTNTPGTLAMNPEHGALGHRCDIAVGAPLNTAVANKVVLPATQPLAQPPVQLSSPVQAAPNKPVVVNPSAATAGLNPAHGAPGHRCDIAVGAPLNSAPTISTQSPAPIQLPAPVQQKTATINSTAKINPAHGQPGHDCSVPVGQPLKQ